MYTDRRLIISILLLLYEVKTSKSINYLCVDLHTQNKSKDVVDLLWIE